MDQLSPDDALEDERPDKLNARVGKERLPEDHDPPASPAEPIDTARLPEDHPSRDTNIDQAEIYDGETDLGGGQNG